MIFREFTKEEKLQDEINKKNMMKDPYYLEELIQILEDVPHDKIDVIKCIYSLSKILEDFQFYKDCVHKIIPMKYKKFNPKEGENPFFSSDDISPTKEDYQKAKERMLKIKQET